MMKTNQNMCSCCRELLNKNSLQTLFEEQKKFQKKVTGIETPKDDVNWYEYHMLAMLEELGEVLKSDKRWKTHRNTSYDPQNKLEEIADMLITLINICLYSNFDSLDVFEKSLNKINENTKKLEEWKNANNS